MGLDQTIRQWRLIQLLHGKKHGLSVQRLMEELGTSHATLYRDINVLLEAGVPLSSETRSGEAWYSFEGAPLVALNPTALQMAALILARKFLDPLEGTQMVAQYDELLARWSNTPAVGLPIEASPPSGRFTKPQILAAIEQAIQKGRRLRFTYLRGGPRVVDPAVFQIKQSVHLYLHAFDSEKKLKTFKPVRMKEAEVLPEAAEAHPELEQEDPLAHSIGAWIEKPIDVAVRLSARKAPFVDEWPMIDGQQLDEQPDGSVIVRARVAGPYEVSKWVLSWGRDAVVLEPPELRKLVRDELAAALSGYSDD
jgi:predicted DNA-binding transcriptional regulator YafY